MQLVKVLATAVAAAVVVTLLKKRSKSQKAPFTVTLRRKRKTTKSVVKSVTVEEVDVEVIGTAIWKKKWRSMRHVVYSGNEGEELAMAISATTAGSTWFDGQKTRFKQFGVSGGSHASRRSDLDLIDIIHGNDDSSCGASAIPKLVPLGTAIRDANHVYFSDTPDEEIEDISKYKSSSNINDRNSCNNNFNNNNNNNNSCNSSDKSGDCDNDNSDKESTDCDDEDDDENGSNKVNCKNIQDGHDSYKHQLWLSLFNSATTVVPTRCIVDSSVSGKWPFRRKKSHLLKRKGHSSLSNVVEIFEHETVANGEHFDYRSSESDSDNANVSVGNGFNVSGTVVDGDGNSTVAPPAAVVASTTPAVISACGNNKNFLTYSNCCDDVTEIIEKCSNRNAFCTAAPAGDRLVPLRNVHNENSAIVEDVSEASNGDRDNDQRHKRNSGNNEKFVNLISVLEDAGHHHNRLPLSDNRRLLSSDYNLCENVSPVETNSCCSRAACKIRRSSLTRSWLDEATEKLHKLNEAIFVDKNTGTAAAAAAAVVTEAVSGAVDNYKWRRRRTFTSVPEDECAVGEIGVESEERVVLLQRSASVPDEDTLSTPPARKPTKTTSTSLLTTKTTSCDDGLNSSSVPLLSSFSKGSLTTTTTTTVPPSYAVKKTMTMTSAMTSSGCKLGKWSKSKIDLLVPSLKSLVTMTTNKLSSSKPTNLNYWRNNGGGSSSGVIGNCVTYNKNKNSYCNINSNNNSNRKNIYTTSRFDARTSGLPSAASLRRNISLNNVTSSKGYSGVEFNSNRDHNDNCMKNASLGDITGMCLLASKKKLRKYNTVLTLSSCVNGNKNNAILSCSSSSSSSGGALHIEPLRPINRLRVCPNSEDLLFPSRMCSRCSSLLSMASSSKYSLNSAFGFVPVSSPNVLCKVCLNEVPLKDSWTLQHCQCSYCVDCVRSYVEFEINQGAYSISCPDAQCEKQGIILLEEIESLVSLENIEKHKRYRSNREVEMDKSRTWCPRAGCETICTLCSKDRCTPQCVHCPTCSMDFCSNCRAAWHAGSPCKSEEIVPGVTFDSELIKCCPMCSVPIEKDEGCAQMLCKRCKHVFCWYCLASLDDDFLLRHYDKGPCKNKLGHSRASVIWHRTQVISIFAGFGILLLIASPLLLLAAPCIVCCKCRVCTSDSKLDADDDLPETTELQANAVDTFTSAEQKVRSSSEM